MVFFLMLLSSCFIYGSTAPDKKVSDLFAGSVSTHVYDFHQPKRVIELVAIVIKHNQPLRTKSGKLTYPELTNFEQFIERIRKINDGFLPLTAPAKDEIVSFLTSNPNKDDALRELYALAGSFDVHPLSVAKIKKAVIQEYKKNDKRVEEFRALSLLSGVASSASASSCVPVPKKAVKAPVISTKEAVNDVIASTNTKTKKRKLSEESK